MELAYLAGLIDGEGSIMLLGQGPRRPRTPEVAVGMTDLPVVEAVCTNFGGFLRTTTRPGRQDMHYWRLKGFAAVELLERLLPLLVIERRRALAELLTNDATIKSRSKGPGHSKVRHNEIMFQQMRAVNDVRLPGPPDLPKRNPSAPDIAYLAGVLDGEGHVTRRRLEVASTDPELPGWIAARFGGGVYLGREARGNQRRIWRWLRTPTGFKWAARVAAHMLIERKRETVAGMQGFKRTPAPAPSLQPTPQDEEFLRLTREGWLHMPAVRESGIAPARARRLQGPSEPHPGGRVAGVATLGT